MHEKTAAKHEGNKKNSIESKVNRHSLDKSKSQSSCNSCGACRTLSSPRLSSEGALSAISQAKTIGKESCAVSFMQRNHGNSFTSSTLSPTIQKKAALCHSEPVSESLALNRTIQKKCSCGGSCTKCKGEEEAERVSLNIMKKESSSISHKPSTISYQPQSNNKEQAQISEIMSNKGSGQTLDNNTRSYMESGFGYEFSHVRLHTDSYAARKSNELNAEAFTIGRDIFFNSGRYSPSSTSGKQLLAHELTHVVQQGGQIGDACFIQKLPTNTPHGRPYTPGDNHGHSPSGRWADIQGIESGNCSIWSEEGRLSCVCANTPPRGILMLAYLHEMSDYPLARAHLVHYVHRGGGADYNENVSDFINRDSRVRSVLSTSISAATRGNFRIEQSDYAVQDFRYAFGAIDRLDYEVDSTAGIVHIWFADRYEYHPVYPGIYAPMPGDVKRPTNCVHAAAVELKASGAADFWMVGYGTVLLSTITGSTPSSGGGTL